MSQTIFLASLLLMHAALTGVSCLKDMHIKVPEAVRVGDTVTLACDYDLEQVALYTIKWYRDDVEFYRYVPKESPPSRVFAVEHIDVDIYQSNSREVTLRDVERETSGEFKCEVSEDAPIFHTEIGAAHLLVADLSDDVPALRTEVQKTAQGSTIRAICTTPGSYPPMNVTWFINDVEIRPKRDIRIDEAINRYEALNDLETVTSTIALSTAHELFKTGKMKLRCLATLFALYTHSVETEIQEDAPQLAPIKVPTTHSNEGINSGFRHSSSTNLLHFHVSTYMLMHLIARLLTIR